jgi:CheY-like chemotaxis protein
VAHDVLTDEGYRVVSAPTHDDALSALTAVRFALILCDTGGASEGGHDARWAAPERIKAASGETPVIIFSAYPPHLFEEFARRGFAGLIAKPFDLDELLETVTAVLTTP